jgi:hypothetical protein
MTGGPAWIPTYTVCQEAREMASNGLTVAQIAELRYIRINLIRQTGRV